MKLAQLTKLFEPGKIGPMEIKNRIIMAPMATMLADDEGYITDRQIDYYVLRAKGGVGLIVLGSGRPAYDSWTKNCIAVWDDKFIPGLRRLAQAVQDNGARVAVQLTHPGVYLSLARAGGGYGVGGIPVDVPEELDVIGPSHVPSVRNNFIPRQASREDIKRLVECFSEGARRIKDAGFDAATFLGGHGYLIWSFFSPLTNKRTDEYGGSPENRARFACEILEAARRKVGPDFCLIFRMSASDYLEGGITLEDSLKQASLLVEAGADALDISASAHESTQWQFLTYHFPDGAIAHLAEAVKKVVRVPVIAVGKLGDPEVAEQVLEQGKADFIALARPLLADPAWPNKAKEGHLEDINSCIYCNLGCVSRDRSKVPQVSCTVNPAVGREREFAPRPVKERRKVMVAGGGIAGMEAARVAAERGHSVTLYERCDKLGGQWNIASMQKGKEAFARFKDRLVRGLERAGVEVVLGREVDRGFVEQIGPEVVVIATGAVPAKLPIPGAEGKNVVQAVDVIQGKGQVGERVVVVGARYLGMELAASLASEGKRVSLVDKIGIGNNVERNTYLTLMERLVKLGVWLYPHAPVYEIRPNGVYLAQNRELLFLEADTVILAVGAKPENRLLKELRWVVPQLCAIGDCVEPRNGFYSIRQGAEVGRQI